MNARIFRFMSAAALLAAPALPRAQALAGRPAQADQGTARLTSPLFSAARSSYCRWSDSENGAYGGEFTVSGTANHRGLSIPVTGAIVLVPNHCTPAGREEIWVRLRLTGQASGFIVAVNRGGIPIPAPAPASYGDDSAPQAPGYFTVTLQDNEVFSHENRSRRRPPAGGGHFGR